ncbi:hypothetical protein JOL79_06715 [Microbispora sp. RL4-1S]|uniref:Uncharacterized protein n=1 Tax=Microbispora oryzae TaxID=2806554 RepID=A0A940WDE3_9ACTN|nr:hypothetical protein [Microbispora oryzae]MBP2703489.1 hypothetical protein [Microbispora oryzae]
MPRRAADLVNVPTRTPEQVRNYGRHADELLGDMANEFVCRRKELAGRLHALLKEAKRQGVDPGDNRWARAMASTLGLLTASLGCRMARAGVRRVYPDMEKYCGVAIDGLRERKYGKAKAAEMRRGGDTGMTV